MKLFLFRIAMRGGLLALLLLLFAPLQLNAETRILFLGDSITAGYGIDKELAFPERVRKMLHNRGHTDVKIINAGVSGSTSASAMSRIKWYSRIQPHIMVLALGGNDGLRGISVKAMTSNLAQTIQFALDKGMKVILAGMQMPPNYGKQYTDEFREAFYTLAERYPITFMPFLLKDVGGRRDLNLPDGIHPTPEGHQLIAENVLPYILENL